MSSTYIDGHVHFYPMYSLSNFLRAARKNIQGAAGVLLLAQPDASPSFSLIERCLPELEGSWEYSQPEPTAYVFRQGEATITMIAGRQLVTSENLEVLALCTDQPLPSGRSLAETLQDARQAHAVPVIPWGFGKWWFSRGQLVRQLMASPPFGFLLGDSGCRPTISIAPLLRHASRRGIGILSGSDPFPLKSHETRAGSYGSVVPREINLLSPAAWMREQLANASSWTSYGFRRGLVSFCCDQIRIRCTAC